MNTINLLFHFYTFIINPILTLFLATRSSILYTNFSYIGGLPQYRGLFLIWTLLSALYFGALLMSCYKKLKQDKTPIRFWILSTVTLLIVSNLIPFHTEPITLFSSIHILFSYCAIGSLSGLIIYLVFLLSYIEPTFYQRLLLIFAFLTFLCITLFIRFSSINGLIEAIYTLSAGILLNLIRMKLNRVLLPGQ